MSQFLLMVIVGLSFAVSAFAAEPVSAPASEPTVMTAEDCAKMTDEAAKKECESKIATETKDAKPAK